MKTARSVGLIFLIATLLNACGATPNNPDTALEKMIGEWEGVGNQNNGSTWTISVAILDAVKVNNVGALISYPSLSCSGTWTLKSSSGNVAIYDEQITSGQGGCIASGQVQLTYNNNDTLSYTYTSGSSTATSTLTRVTK